MEPNNIDMFLNMKDAAYDYCQKLYRLYQLSITEYNNAKISKINNDDLFDVFSYMMVDQFQYLSAKYQHFYFTNIEIERLVVRYRPYWKLFSPVDFECLIQSILFLMEGKVYKLTKSSHDEGIDLVYDRPLYDGDMWVANIRNVVQCKLYRGSVSVSHIRDFFGVMSAEVAEGYFFTTGKITRSGLDFIKKAINSPMTNSIYFIDQERISQLIELTDMIAFFWESLGSIDPDLPDFDSKFDYFWDERAKTQQQAKAIIRYSNQPDIEQLSLSDI